MYNNLFLPNGKFLGDVISKLPHNKIIYKHLTGCGATHLELFCNRWSIIVEPYIPVILGKQWMEKKDDNGKSIKDDNGNPIMVKNPEVLAVYEKTKTDDIVDFLSVKRSKYKLVTTPEGMKKIMDACDELGINPYEKFFLLVDECEKLIQDANFRESITEVMNYFFSFKKRSFISATPLPPSDPRFSQYGFDDYMVNPEVDEKLKIDVYTTNNIASTLKKYLDTNKNDNYLIFINSTERIASIIDFLKINDESQVFCSKESADVLRANHIKNATEHWDNEKFKKYNFFTSRFFTAFDLKVNCKPNVLIISDVVNVPHSVLDPKTDIIQIEGRARNGINHLAHITNWDASLKSKSEGETKAYIEAMQLGYNWILQLLNQCNNNENTGTYSVIKSALETSIFNRFFNTHTNDLSYFMMDNEIHSNRINGYYRSADKIIKAYNETGRFDITPINERYNLEDKDLDRLKKGISKKKTMEYVCEAFELHFQQDKGLMFNLNPNFALFELIRTHQTKYRYYRTLGIEQIREFDYDENKISKAYALEEIMASDSFFKMMLSFLVVFKPNMKLTPNQIKYRMEKLFERFKVHLPVTLKQFKYWFDISPRTTLYYKQDGTEVKGHIIIGAKNGVELPKPFRQ